MTRKYKNPRKPNIISLRISDEEMQAIQQVMNATNAKASDLMRDAFALIKAQWEMSGTTNTPLKS